MAEDTVSMKVRDSVYALIATYLAKGTKDIVNDFPTIPKSDGLRIFSFDGADYPVTVRAANDFMVTPGVNIYFGDDRPANSRSKPQKYFLQVFIHINLQWDKQGRVTEKASHRVSNLIDEAFEGMGGTLQVYDLSTGTPAPVPNRFVNWALSPRMTWSEVASPTEDVFTNRIGQFEVRYAG